VTNDSYFGSEYRNGSNTNHYQDSGKVSDSKNTLQQTGERGLNFVVNVIQNIKDLGNNKTGHYNSSSSVNNNSGSGYSGGGYSGGYNKGAGSYNSYNGNYSPSPQNDRLKSQNQGPSNNSYNNNTTTRNDSTYGTKQTNLRNPQYSNYQ